jgi:hypothetical protein
MNQPPGVPAAQTNIMPAAISPLPTTSDWNEAATFIGSHAA